MQMLPGETPIRYDLIAHRARLFDVAPMTAFGSILLVITQDCQGGWPHLPGHVARPRRRGDRV